MANPYSKPKFWDTTSPTFFTGMRLWALIGLFISYLYVAWGMLLPLVLLALPFLIGAASGAVFYTVARYICHKAVHDTWVATGEERKPFFY